MNRKLTTPILILLLLGSSLVFYAIQHVLFDRPGETAFYFLQDLAFVPINVLLVTVGLNTVLNRHDQQSKLEKVSIVVNEFFAEAGTELIQAIHPGIVNLDAVSTRLQPNGRWTDKDFDDVIEFLGQYKTKIDVKRLDLTDLHELLRLKKGQILHLFENANLLENDRFTDMLWAVYHVHDELRSRTRYDNLPPSDIQHLNQDVQRAIQLLLVEWIESMRSLKKRYPYLYSLACRKCPFGSCDVIIQE